ncbi:MAG: tryptophan--tRNA ligase [Candidatus Terrybacteria bacterium RIFCSPHIGHO2_02_41_19]|uniref:Tryptophan--tRNA ligase n=1 Tax=Candidatus Terrybacteria bacterium RIFCSPHIGHO2_02_41_19 TaxID=1802364 RepID=A0A1G2PLF3_9BACT|nr:MAG: tryptophan--tRNA ligase [Candidatus Terrybacteria bacterium RIFCSPHIGHO2_02_41_19]
MPNKKKIIFSATAPSGNIHIGNYIGAIKQWAELQNTGEHQNIFCVVDEHAITTPQEPAKLRSKILEVFTLYLALGIDPEKSIIFVQSSVSEHTELAWILNTITPIGELERMTQFKDKSQKQKSVLAGLLNYPTLMAADILLYKTNLVPIGEDQLQHIELTRTIARKFNSTFGETFAIPEPFINKEGKRIMGLDDPLKKMSKSAENPKNYIALLDSPETIREKIKAAVTDSASEIKYDMENKPAISNLLTIYSLFSRKTIAELEKEYDGKNYSVFKNDLAEIIIEGLSPIQKKYKELSANPDYIKKVLRNGAEKAKTIASQTMSEVRSKIGFLEI